MTDAPDPWAPGESVIVDGQPAVIDWVQQAPRREFYWVGYSRDGVSFRGVHVSAAGFDTKGRKVIAPAEEVAACG